VEDTLASVKKPSPKSEETPVVVRVLTETERDNLLADAYLVDRVYDALLERGGASKVSELTQEIENPNIPFALVRRALDSSARFTMVDRQWNLAARYSDTGKPIDRALTDVLRTAGKPLSTAQIATELSNVYNRPAEVYFSLIASALTNTRVYFKAAKNTYGLTEWLPLVDGEDLGEVLADNKLKPDSVKPLLTANAKVGWESGYADATYRLVTALKGRAVSHKMLGVLGWIALGEKYDAKAHLIACFADARLLWISAQKANGRWITKDVSVKLEGILSERAKSIGEETEESIPQPVASAPVVSEPVSASMTEAAVTAAAAVEVPLTKPLQISESDLAALAKLLLDREAPVESSELLNSQYEVAMGDPSFTSDLAALESALKNDARFLYIGAGRFCEPEVIPSFVYDFPDVLAFPDFQFVSMDGEIMDEEISDEGFVGNLRQEVLNSLGQDAGDDEGHFTGDAPEDAAMARLVVKAHHKEIGTFPLCQLIDGFFPNDASIVQVALREIDGTVHDVIINNDLRMAFNLFDLYSKIESESGGVLIVHQTNKPYEYKVEVTLEHDPRIYLDPARHAELNTLREQVEEAGDVATFDLVCEILESHAKGIDFVGLLTEINIVRRVTRRKLASILSNYYCFSQKAGVNTWRFDSKKREMGTDRSKRQYIQR
jgi:hypothetical protein